MLTREMLASVLTFDPEKGRFYWVAGAGRGKPEGKEAGSFDAHGYGQINVFGKVWKEHRLAWLWIYGELPSDQIDHINHDRRDNRPCNLRAANNVENHKNRPMQNSNKSGFIGVHFNKNAKKYEAYITVDKVRQKLGYFDNFEDAVAARKAANEKYGFHQNHGATIGRPKHKKLASMLKELGIETPPGKLSKDELSTICEHSRMHATQLKKGIALCE